MPTRTFYSYWATRKKTSGGEGLKEIFFFKSFKKALEFIVLLLYPWKIIYKRKLQS